MHMKNFTEIKGKLQDIDPLNKSNKTFKADKMEVFFTALESCSGETAKHCKRVSYYSQKIGVGLGLNDFDMRKLFFASMLHDIGKTCIPKAILDKKGKLTDEEFDTVKTHTERGCELISKIEGFKEISQVILCHHERYDGKGYPKGICAEDIPLLSRIISVADAFDAMTSERAYRNMISCHDAFGELNKYKWSQFDGKVVEVFCASMKNE